MSVSSWKDGLSEYGDEIMGNIASETNVAGIHTDHKERYGSGNGWAAPGLYGVMGKRNIAEVQERVLGIQPTDPGTLAAAALIGRELSAQDGHLPQAFAIRLARIAYEDPGFVVRVAESFGPPDAWLTRPLPDLNELRHRIGLPLR